MNVAPRLSIAINTPRGISTARVIPPAAVDFMHTACLISVPRHGHTSWFEVSTARTFHKDLRSPNKFLSITHLTFYHHQNYLEYFLTRRFADHRKRHNSPRQKNLWTQRVPLNAFHLPRASHPWNVPLQAAKLRKVLRRAR